MCRDSLRTWLAIGSRRPRLEDYRAFYLGASAEARKLPANCSEAKPTIGVALPNTVNPYYIAMQDSFKKNGAAHGFNVNVAIANDSDSNQLSQIEAFIQQGVCAVVLNAVNSGPGAASVRCILARRLPSTVIVDGVRGCVSAQATMSARPVAMNRSTSSFTCMCAKPITPTR